MQIPDYRNLKQYDLSSLKSLAQEIRGYILESVHNQGGHVASNLGVVEITLGIAKIFDLDQDAVIFDTSHQSYTYKLLTGRSEYLPTIRTLGGLSGFTDPVESIYDKYYAGHAGTGLSLAYGEAMARKLKGTPGRVLVAVGDGALTNGVSYEGLNNIGASGLPIVIILNDNEHSISKNVGAMAAYLAKLRSSGTYKSMKNFVSSTLRKAGAKNIEEALEKAKLALKEAFQLDTFFEKLGIVYLGPFDGNDMESVLVALEIAQSFDKPTVVHFLTKKGAGYEPAERSPVAFHSAGPFNVTTGEIAGEKARTFTKAFGDFMAEIGENADVVALTAAMTDGTGLSQFAEKYPDRFIDVGIAEEHVVLTATAMASHGFKPVVAVYSTFMQRAYDQLIHDVALPKRHVVFALDRAGLVPSDGPTHQGLWDIAYALHIPNSRIYAPFDEESLRDSLQEALESDVPCFVRYPKAPLLQVELEKRGSFMYAGYGEDVTFVAYGPMVLQAVSALDHLKEHGIMGEVFGLWQVRPVPEGLLQHLQNKESIYVVEEGIKDYGAAAFLRSFGLRVYSLGVADPFVPAGNRDQLLRLCELDANGIAKRVLRREFSRRPFRQGKRSYLFTNSSPAPSLVIKRLGK